MLFYIILFIICVFLSYFSSFLHENKYENKKVLFLIDFLPYLILIIITGFRYNVGTDYIGYTRNFVTLKYADIERIEFSFRLIVSMVHQLGLDQQLMFFIYSTITYTLIFLGVRYFDPEGKYRHFVMALLITLFLFNIFNTIRQMAAVAIIFYSLKYILEKKYIIYVVLILLGYFFHKSAIVFGVFFLIILQFNIRFYLGLLIVAPVMFFTNFINFVISLYVRFTGSVFYQIYASGGNARVNVSSGIGILIFFVIAVIFYIFYDQIVKTKKQEMIVKLYIIYASLYLIFLPSEIATRMLYYPLMIVPLALPLLIEISKDEKEQIYIKYVMIAIVLLLFGDLMLSSIPYFESGGVLEYAFRFIGKG
ncbi:MAG: EpsG family protein [Acholeplasmataceae bacterium]|nr:EpsG family protein [Acholeplasmataceae bacterium]